jgi:hypothetical protein
VLSRQKEEQLTKTILANNEYPQYIHKNNRQRKEHETVTNSTKKWVTLTYIGNETRAIAKLFKNTNVKVTYRTNNTIQNHLRERRKNNNIYERCGVYQLKCGGCQKKVCRADG